ncbi:DUF5412 family protein [Azospirillum sp.]|uniref:DUF5412 family protein n=1 Tax=Azospirillum sp. TaxID=34012 RepID=UPI002D427E03|nr:DUF5412 family protein [Azospirillum sp.]HYF88123.1 DUF5412 family protein [Azospirillum sp.]
MGASKNRMLRIFFISVSIAVALIIIFFSAVYIYINFFFSFCEVESFGVTPSPNGETSVVIYSIDCGAGSRFNTRAALAPAKKEFVPGKSKQFLHVRGQHDFHVRWIDAATVEITAADAADAFGEGNIVQRENSMDGVAISYR